MNNLPSNWQIKSLGEVTNVKSGFAFKSNDYLPKGVRLVRIGNLNGRSLEFGNETVYVDERYLNTCADFELKEDDVLIAMSGATTGKLAFVKKTDLPCLLNQRVGLISIRNKQDLDSKYLFFYLAKGDLRKNVLKLAGGSAQPNISPSQIMSFRIPIPPIPVQKQIAEILEKADQAKQKRKEADKLTEQFLQSAFIEMFGDPVKNLKGWKKVSFEEVADIERESVCSEDFKENDIYIGLEHIEKETGKLLGFVRVDEIDLKSNKFKFTSEHILYGKLRPNLNKVCLPNFQGVCSTDIIPIKPKTSISNRYFLTYLLRQEFFVKEATAKSAGANLPRISPNILESFQIYIPPLPLQQKFATLVEKTEALKEKQKQSGKELENLFNSLMQKGVKGELIY